MNHTRDLGTELQRKLDAWSDSGRTAYFWWRDDDAVSDTPALRQLIGMAEQAGITLAIGVVPERADPSVLTAIPGPEFPLWQHGWCHEWYEDGEFGMSRPLGRMIEDALRGQQVLDEKLHASNWQRVFVPPQHSLAMSFKALIPTLGYAGVSAGVPLTPSVEGVFEINAEIDVMNWSTRKLLTLEQIRAMLLEQLDQRWQGLTPVSSPIGLLTHHLAFDADAWAGVATILNALVAHPAVRFRRAAELFASKESSAAQVTPATGAAAVSVVITSCGRQDLLRRTVDSFFAFNTSPVQQVVVIEDGQAEANSSLVEQYAGRNIKWMATGARRGQIPAIDMAYAQVGTEFIFHCEDDWEFYQPGFIEKSLAVLQANPLILQVWLRAFSDTNNHPILSPTLFAGDVPYRLMHPDFHTEHWGVWHGFSWNPGLRRRREYDLIGSFSGFDCDRQKTGLDLEREISEFYRRRGYVAAILADYDGTGYVRHLGWGRRVSESVASSGEGFA